MAESAQNGGAGRAGSPGGLLRPRAAWQGRLSLAANLAGFAAVNVFWHYLTTGRAADFRLASYYRDLTTPLAEAFLHPLNVLTHPWMLLVGGLLLGLLLLVPVGVSVLYRSLASLPFVAAVVVLGHGPVLALAVGVGCVLAGRGRLRQEMPFVAVLVALLPAGAYLALSATAGTDAEAVLPLQRWAIYAPLVIAAVSATIAAAGVLALAKLLAFRPGVLCPFLVGLLAAPLTVFYAEVGTDELDYCLLAARMQSSESLFDDEALGPWQRRVRGVGLTGEAIENAVAEDLAARRDELLGRCRRFLRRHPTSRRKAAVMWLRAQAASLAVDQQALRRGLIRCTAAFPLDSSADEWEALRAECPGTPQAALAEARLGELALRRMGGNDANAPAAAEELLRGAGEALAKAVAAGRAAPATAQVFAALPDQPSAEHLRAALLRAAELAWLAGQNDVRDDAAAAEAMGAFLRLDPRGSGYYGQLMALLADGDKKRERSRFGDNLKLAVALNTPDVYDRAEMLIQLARDERTDAAIAANFELGLLALKTADARAIRLLPGLKAPEEYFRTVLASPPNPYQVKAAELLASLAVKPAERP